MAIVDEAVERDALLAVAIFEACAARGSRGVPRVDDTAAVGGNGKSRPPPSPDAATRSARCSESGTRAVPETPIVGNESSVARAITSCGPTASRVITSITPPGPPGPSIGDCGVVESRTCTMSVIGIAETSNAP